MVRHRRGARRGLLSIEARTRRGRALLTDLSWSVLGCCPSPSGKHSKLAVAPSETPTPQLRSSSR
eukprot:6214275-Pleurochrysis_carterae.AAC.4